MTTTELATPLEAGDTPLRTLLPAWRPTGAIVPRWEQHIGAYLRSLALAVRPGTARTYAEVLARFIREAGDPLEATRADVEAFLTRDRRGRQGTRPGARAAATTVTERAGLRRYFAWAVREGLRPDNPTDGVGTPRRQPYRDVRALTADEARPLLAAIPVETVAGLRLHTLATWFLITGRCHAEVLRLRWEYIDLEERSYTYEGKGGKSERRELVSELVEVTERWARASAPDMPPTALVFPGRWADEPVSPQLIRQQLQLVARQAGLGDLRRPIHTLRHTNARLRREVGASIEDVQAALDHSSLATTAVYLRKLEGSTDVYGARVGALLTRPGVPSGLEPDAR
jgi:integrase/recombinase XerD